MALDIRGRITQILPLQSGSSVRGEWKKQEFILETEEQYPRKICMSLWGDRIRELSGIDKNETVTVSVNIESREYQGRWYTEARAWRIQRGQASSAGNVVNAPPAAPIVSEDDYMASADSSFDDLPF